jgi:hypothetical protein
VPKEEECLGCAKFCVRSWRQVYSGAQLSMKGFNMGFIWPSPLTCTAFSPILKFILPCAQAFQEFCFTMEIIWESIYFIENYFSIWMQQFHFCTKEPINYCPFFGLEKCEGFIKGKIWSIYLLSKLHIQITFGIGVLYVEFLTKHQLLNQVVTHPPNIHMLVH